ncbi:unnamed protein product [Nippostrongylus brasiliensis]|uniref:Ovule protein n=1 Tax=Nippostrongylus brasiliensis TaxID=27835 RepID=A0A0N4XK76_NIPBR|nr:unnamed protein product [Nippostrongylus brasiliensis]
MFLASSISDFTPLSGSFLHGVTIRQNESSWRNQPKSSSKKKLDQQPIEIFVVKNDSHHTRDHGRQLALLDFFESIPISSQSLTEVHSGAHQS